MQINVFLRHGIRHVIGICASLNCANGKVNFAIRIRIISIIYKNFVLEIEIRSKTNLNLDHKIFITYQMGCFDVQIIIRGIKCTLRKKSIINAINALLFVTSQGEPIYNNHKSSAEHAI